MFTHKNLILKEFVLQNFDLNITLFWQICIFSALKKQKPITKEMGENLVKKLKLNQYLECSAYTQDGLKTVFDEVSQQLRI